MRSSLFFFVNDRLHEIGDQRAGWTLAEFLRWDRRLVGTKVVCAEGDCGSCTVLLGRPQTCSNALRYEAVDSCIVFLYQLDRTHVVTIEGLGGCESLSPVQQAMIDCHGSQCGFCTPGFVAALHGMVEQHDAELNGAANLADDEMRYGLTGNLCRCTGYAQILEAGRSLQLAQVSRMKDRYATDAMLDTFAQLPNEPIHIQTAGADGESFEVFVPQSLDEAVRFRSANPHTKIVAGATDVGVLRNHGRLEPQSILSLGGIAELDSIEVDEDDVLHLGAGACWSRVLKATEKRLPEFAQILRRFGSPQIRNLATVGGNIVNASPIADSLPLFYVLDAELELVSPAGERRVAIDDFYLGYKQLELAADELLAAVHCRLPAQDEKLKLYKVSKRRDLDISTAMAGFWLRVVDEQITAARFAAGGVGPTVLRLPLAEAHVLDQPFSETTMRDAGRIARQEVRPISDLRAGADYRGQLVENLFVKAYFDLAPQLVEV